MSFPKNIWSKSIPPPKTSDQELNSAIQAFLNKGGKPQIIRDDHGSYDKNLKKIQSSLKGGFNPFSKAEALTVNKDSLQDKRK